MPKISVLLSVFNSEEVLERALSSLVSQSFKDFEILVLDDGSTDSSARIIDDFVKKDHRIKAFYFDSNLGLAKRLNFLLGEASAPLIARADADDCYHPERLQKQYDRICNDESIDVLGTWGFYVDGNGTILSKVMMPINHEDIVQRIAKSNPFLHSSILAKKSFFIKNGGYKENLRKKQDYDLWVRGLKKARYENLPEYLIYYRFDENKSLLTDLYGFRVRCLNFLTLGDPRCLYYAVAVLGYNFLKKMRFK